MAITGDRLFAILVGWTVTAASLLRDGVLYHNVPLIVIGGVMSAVCPWGVVVMRLVRRCRG